MGLNDRMIDEVKRQLDKSWLKTGMLLVLSDLTYSQNLAKSTLGTMTLASDSQLDSFLSGKTSAASFMSQCLENKRSSSDESAENLRELLAEKDAEIGRLKRSLTTANKDSDYWYKQCWALKNKTDSETKKKVVVLKKPTAPRDINQVLAICFPGQVKKK